MPPCTGLREPGQGPPSGEAGRGCRSEGAAAPQARASLRTPVGQRDLGGRPRCLPTECLRSWDVLEKHLGADHVC